MAHKIAVTGRGLGRNHGEASRQQRQRKSGIHIHHSLLLQPFDSPAPLEFQPSESERRVYIGNDQRERVQFGILHPGLHQHIHSHLQVLPRLTDEIGLQDPPRRGPYNGRDLGLQAAVRLREGQIAVAGGVILDLAYLGAYPYRAGKTGLDIFPDHPEQFLQAQDTSLSFPFSHNTLAILSPSRRGRMKFSSLPSAATASLKAMIPRDCGSPLGCSP